MAKEDRSLSPFPMAYLKHLESRTDPGMETRVGRRLEIEE